MDMKDRVFELRFPVTRQHCGIPLANGDLGIMLFGGERTFELELSLSGCWDHRFSERLEQPCPYKELVAINDKYDITPVRNMLHAASRPEASKDPYCGKWLTGTRVAGGRFRFDVSGDLETMSLDYGTGIVTVQTAVGSFRLALSPGCNVVMIEDACRIVSGVTPDPMWNRLSELYLNVGYSAPTVYEDGWFQPLPADAGTLAFAKRQAWGWAVTASLSTDGIDRFGAIPSCEAVFAKTEAWWTAYWSRQPEIETPEAFINDFFIHALYKFGCATNPSGKACGLQGPWIEDYQRPPWSCDYHFNVNVQQIYTLAFATGNLEHLDPLFAMLESEAYQNVMSRNAKMMFGIDDGLLMMHALDDRGWQVGWIGAGAVLDFACGGWTALLYWWRYRYSGDIGFLRDRAMPFMRGIMRVYEEALEEHEGRLSLPLAISAEYGCTFKVQIDGKTVRQNTGRDPSSQLSCIHALVNGLLAGCRILGEEPKAIWLDIKKRLPHMVTVGEGDQEHIGIWEGQDLDVCHRHHSHLSLIYPFDIMAELTEEEEEWVTRGIDHWILRGMGQWSEWCYPWAIQIQVRRGFQDSPVILFDLWRKIFVNEGMATAYLPRFQGITAHRKADMVKPKETHEVMQLDGTMAGATAMIELLIYELAGVFHVFAGIPDSWQDACFKNVCLPNGWRISAERRGGRLVSCVIKARLEGQLRFVLEPGSEETVVSLPAGGEWSL